MSRAKNEWWISQKNALHIGNEIIIDDGNMTIPSFRYSYNEIQNLKIFSDPSYPEYCLVYSSSFPILDVWKYTVKNQTIAGTTYKKLISLPSFIDVYHVDRIASRPYSPSHITFQEQYIIHWSNNNKSIFDISKESFIDEILPIRNSNDYNIKEMKTLNYLNYSIKYADEFEYVDVFNNDLFIFRLNHNIYKSHHCCTIIEVVDDRILINDEHSSFGIYDMSGNLCHYICREDEFYTHKFRVTEDDKEYLVVYGFIWAPILFMSIYDLQQMIIDKSYEPDQYWEKDTHDLTEQDRTKYKENRVCFGMTPKHFKEYMIEKKNKELIEKQQLLHTRWNDSILRYILSKYNRLDFENCPTVTCVGGNSGFEFTDHADNIILKQINDKNPNIIIDTIARMVFGDNYTNWKKNGTNLKEVNLIFTIDNKLKMQIIIPMVVIPDKKTYWFPDDDDAVKINFME
jgi:hypothetical protein